MKNNQTTNANTMNTYNKKLWTPKWTPYEAMKNVIQIFYLSHSIDSDLVQRILPKLGAMKFMTHGSENNTEIECPSIFNDILEAAINVTFHPNQQLTLDGSSWRRMLYKQP